MWVLWKYCATLYKGLDLLQTANLRGRGSGFLEPKQTNNKLKPVTETMGESSKHRWEVHITKTVPEFKNLFAI